MLGIAHRADPSGRSYRSAVTEPSWFVLGSCRKGCLDVPGQQRKTSVARSMRPRWLRVSKCHV
jgi:hypothetical protein